MNIKTFSKYVGLVFLASLAVACSSSKKAGDSGSGSGGEFAGFTADELKSTYNTVYFDFDSYDITAESQRILNGHAALIVATKAAVKVDGHADERGTAEYNIALGQRRANAIKQYLVESGVSAKDISTLSYGKEKPVAHEHNEEAYAKNRRGVIGYK